MRLFTAERASRRASLQFRDGNRVATLFPSPRAPSIPARRRRLTTWDSVLQVQFLKSLRPENIELESGKRFQR